MAHLAKSIKLFLVKGGNASTFKNHLLYEHLHRQHLGHREAASVLGKSHETKHHLNKVATGQGPGPTEMCQGSASMLQLQTRGPRPGRVFCIVEVGLQSSQGAPKRGASRSHGQKNVPGHCWGEGEAGTSQGREQLLEGGKGKTRESPRRLRRDPASPTAWV